MAGYQYLMLLALLSGTYGSDPCQTGYTFKTLPRSKYRGTNCSGKGIVRRTSDALLPTEWYRVQNHNGNYLSLAMQPPDISTCSSYNPIWMNASTPRFADGIVDRSVCIRTSESNVCEQSWNIKVRNCSSFIAYRLSGSGFTDSAYCFGEKENCPPFDPCEEFYRQEDLHDDGLRSKNCQSKVPGCDNTLTEGWYKLTDESWRHPANLLRQAPAINSCGTEKPLWLNGTIPKEMDGEVQRSICVSVSSDSCGKSFKIKVKNCSAYIVYQLKPATQCPQRYCLDTDGMCQNNPMTTSSNSMSTNSTDRKETSDGVNLKIIVIALLGAIVGLWIIGLIVLCLWAIINISVGKNLMKTFPMNNVPQKGVINTKTRV